MNPNDDAFPPPPDDAIDALAGEYVLGTLTREARSDVETRLAREPALRAAVQAWEARLHPLVALAEPQEPDPGLWRRIEASLPAQPQPQPQRPAGAMRTGGRAAGWWHNLALWRGLAGAGFMAAAVLAAVLVGRAPPTGPTTTQFLVVLVAPQDKSPGWVVQTAEGGRQLSLIPLGSVTVPGDRALQFWTKADDWGAPVSLGLVTPGQTLTVPLGQLPPMEPNQLFELTLEPSTGSPTGRPTGPIQFIGRAVRVL